MELKHFIVPLFVIIIIVFFIVVFYYGGWPFVEMLVAKILAVLEPYILL